MTHEIAAKLKFGSQLYGTNSPESDTDYKTIFVPSFVKYVCGDQQQQFKIKQHPDGSIAGPNDVMGAGCVEEEFISVPHFFSMLASGEVQTIECFFAILQQKFEFCDPKFLKLCEKFNHEYMHSVPIYNMVGFAKKSAIDYVLRAERMETIQKVIRFFEAVQTRVTKGRLDSMLDGVTVIELLRAENIQGLEFGEIPIYKNGNTQIPCFYVAARCFGATTPIDNVLQGLYSIKNKYGHRVTKVQGKVEWKSMAHAVRTYEQAIEFLSTKQITFPRPNAEDLRLIIKNGYTEEEIFERLRVADKQIQNIEKIGPVNITDFLINDVFDFILEKQ